MGIFTDLISPTTKKTGKVSSKHLEINYTSILNEIHTAEAQEHGLTLLYKSNNSVYGWFKVNICNHEMFLHYGAIRKANTDNFRCKECLYIKLKDEATACGIELLGGREIGMKVDERRYRLPCGHTPILRTSNVRQHGALCFECIEQKHNVEAERVGLVLLCKAPNIIQNRLYMLPCGHTKELSTRSVRNDSWLCRICQENRNEKDAETAGITLNKHIKAHHHDYRNYTLSCGCSKDILVACVRRGAFECKNHSERFIDYSRNISVYIVKFKLEIGEFVKVGFAMDVQGRFQRYGLDGQYESLFIRNFENGQEAVNLEKSIHTRFNHLKVDREIMRKYMENGFTECYPISCMGLLLEAADE
jgi:transposase-like protein